MKKIENSGFVLNVSHKTIPEWNEVFALFEKFNEIKKDKSAENIRFRMGNYIDGDDCIIVDWDTKE